MGCDATIDNIVVVGQVIFVSPNVVVGQYVIIGLIVMRVLLALLRIRGSIKLLLAHKLCLIWCLRLSDWRMARILILIRIIWINIIMMRIVEIIMLARLLIRHLVIDLHIT